MARPLFVLGWRLSRPGRSQQRRWGRSERTFGSARRLAERRPASHLVWKLLAHQGIVLIIDKECIMTKNALGSAYAWAIAVACVAF